MEKKQKKARREKKEADNLVDEGGTDTGRTSALNSKLGNSNLSRRKVSSSVDFNNERKLGNM